MHKHSICPPQPSAAGQSSHRTWLQQHKPAKIGISLVSIVTSVGLLSTPASAAADAGGTDADTGGAAGFVDDIVTGELKLI
jgi:hypothetical protein